MSLPIPFLIGLAILLVHDQLSDFLPGEATFAGLAPWLLAVPLPALIAYRTGLALREAAITGKPLARRAALLARVQGLAVPAVFAVLIVAGGLGNLVEQAIPASAMQQFLALLVPLFLIELSRMLVELRTARAIERHGQASPVAVPSGQLAMTVFLLAPIILFAIFAEILVTNRSALVLFHATAIGSTVGLLMVVAALCVCLPLAFRWVLPLQTSLPPHLDEDVRATAARLGFPRRGVLAMHTGLRLVNAALVGPLRWPRYLVLTDGIMTLLDRFALRGVVAHEIGHARAGHPGWLLTVFVVVPALLMHPLSLVDYDSFGAWTQVGLAVAVLIVAAGVFRAVSRRFEFEADQISAEALGGVEPCVAALRRVGDLFPGHRSRSSLRHPSEQQRVERLLVLESDARARAEFQRGGRRLRGAILVVLAVALGVSAWAHSSSWPIDRAFYLMYTGDFRGARAQLDGLPEEPFGITPDALHEFEQEVDAAVALLGAGGEWNAIQDELADRAWQRGVEVLGRNGPADARPWFALALSRSAPTAVRQTTYLYCAAAARSEPDQLPRLRAHLERLGAPSAVLERL